MKKRILSLLIALVGCTAAYCGRVVITGEVINRPADGLRVLSVHPQDPFIGSTSFVFDLEKQSTFRAEFDLAFGHAVGVEYGYTTTFYAAPGDSIHLLIDAGKYQRHEADALVYGGSQADLNRMTHQLKRRVAPAVRQLRWPDFQAASDTIRRYLTLEYTRLQDSIQAHARAQGIPAEVSRLLERSLLYDIAGRCIIRCLMSKNQAALTLLHCPPFNRYDAEDLRHSSFCAYLAQVAVEPLQRDTLTQRYLRAKQQEKAHAHVLSCLLQQPRTLFRDIVLGTYLTSNNLPLPDASAFVNPEIYRLLQQQDEASRTASSPAIDPTCPPGEVLYLDGTRAQAVPTTDILAHLHKRYAGKLVYIDIWATWCQPCLRQMAYAPDLHKLYEGKDVVFVNLCLGSQPGQWLSLIADKHIVGENYYLDGETDRRLRSTLKIRSFPSYLLLGRDGKLLSRKAPRPSQLAQTVEWLDGLLYNR